MHGRKKSESAVTGITVHEEQGYHHLRISISVHICVREKQEGRRTSGNNY